MPVVSPKQTFASQRCVWPVLKTDCRFLAMVCAWHALRLVAALSVVAKGRFHQEGLGMLKQWRLSCLNDPKGFGAKLATPQGTTQWTSTPVQHCFGYKNFWAADVGYISFTANGAGHYDLSATKILRLHWTSKDTEIFMYILTVNIDKAKKMPLVFVYLCFHTNSFEPGYLSRTSNPSVKSWITSISKIIARSLELLNGRVKDVKMENLAESSQNFWIWTELFILLWARSCCEQRV